MTGTGPGGTITPLDGPKKKRQKSNGGQYGRPKDIPLSPALKAITVTARKLGTGEYQKKMLAHFAQYLVPEFLNSLNRRLRADDPAAARLFAEMTNFVQTKGGINIALNQTSQTANIGRSLPDDGSIRSFEDIARMLDDQRHQRALAPAIDAVFVPTPE